MGARARAAAPAGDLAARGRARQRADPKAHARRREDCGAPRGVSASTPPVESVLNPPDVSLVLAARDGDRAALAALIASHAPSIAQFCRRLAGPHLSDDCTQDTLLLATLRLPHLRD